MKIDKPYDEQSIVEKLRNRAAIRRQIPNRKSVENGEEDRLANLLDEAANEICDLNVQVYRLQKAINYTP